MELKDILGNLNDDQIKSLKELLNSDSKSVVDYLQSREDEKGKQINEQQDKEQVKAAEQRQEKVERERLIAEKSKIQIINAENNFSDFDKVKMDLKNLFNSVTSSNEDKDLTSKLHDRITAIVTEYVIIKAYSEILDDIDDEYLHKLAENHQEEPKKDPEFELLRHFIIGRKSNLESQYRLLSYIYGELIGLPDEQVINKGLSLKDYSPEELYGDTMDNGKTIIDNINNFYLDKYNDRYFYCVRDENNRLSYPKSGNAVIIPLGLTTYDSEFKFSQEAYKKYYPFSDDKIKSLFDEILRPYYEKFGGIREKTFITEEMHITDGYKDDTGYYDRVFFGSEYEYNLTQQLVNEYLSQKENNRQI